MNKKVLCGLALLVLISSGCKKKSTTGNDDYTYPTVTLTHAGFDFSAGICDTAAWPNGNDVDIISWRPDNPDSNQPYPSWSNYLWCRTSADTVTFKSETKDMGAVELSSITSAAVTWDTMPIPLIVGHCLVVRCKDGYAKIQVTTVGDSASWEAGVKYFYSSTTTFAH
ncbi:MAG: hypothetical protein PHX21_10005 [bacterium]|nr:hypothetical protein [bacterium]